MSENSHFRFDSRLQNTGFFYLKKIESVLNIRCREHLVKARKNVKKKLNRASYSRMPFPYTYEDLLKKLYQKSILKITSRLKVEVVIYGSTVKNQSLY